VDRIRQARLAGERVIRSKLASVQRRLIQRVFPAAKAQRYRAGLLAGVHNEWSLLYSPACDASGSSDELVELGARAALRALQVDLGPIRVRHLSAEQRSALVWPGEHYRLLAALADVWGAHEIVEIGTFRGASALTFLLADSVDHVVTFDVVSWDEVEGSLLQLDDFNGRLEQRLGDVARDDVFNTARAALQDADIIFVDAPKDGVFEYQFLPKLLALPVTKRQLVVLDDVRLMPMVSLWRSIPLPKLDIGSFGHYSGTGILIRTEAVDWAPPPPTMTPTWKRSNSTDRADQFVR
jgi:predicted O-methyltransferase YrrM